MNVWGHMALLWKPGTAKTESSGAWQMSVSSFSNSVKLQRINMKCTVEWAASQNKLFTDMHSERRLWMGSVPSAELWLCWRRALSLSHSWERECCTPWDYCTLKRLYFRAYHWHWHSRGKARVAWPPKYTSVNAVTSKKEWAGFLISVQVFGCDKWYSIWCLLEGIKMRSMLGVIWGYFEFARVLSINSR